MDYIVEVLGALYRGDYNLVLWLMVDGLFSLILANTFMLSLEGKRFKWKYFIFTLFAYAGASLLTYTAGGLRALIPTIGSLLGRELQLFLIHMGSRYDSWKDT